ncbi:MAG TPA: tannase/feruloyl esterase family alpha/beta hydrolase [Novosphingobium sp.]|nr:tannase/feruloyl esterase family alpha/beta hydrolase [Novosphingobium sp.]
MIRRILSLALALLAALLLPAGAALAQPGGPDDAGGEQRGISLPPMAAPAPHAPRAVPVHPIADLAPLAPAVGCASLAALDISRQVMAKTTLAAEEVAGTDSAQGYCKVSGTIFPQVHFELRLPLKGWTQRYLQTGCGGLCGMLRIDAPQAESCAPVTDGSVAIASTDMGHQGMDAAWGKSLAQRQDFADRSLHETAVAAKALIRAFYGKSVRYAYFAGCSDGGREALIEAQRFPGDFDGILAGAPALHFAYQNSFHHAWLAAANTGADGKPILLAADMAPLHAAVLKACDGLDGLEDGQITDPRACHFDPAVVQCAGAYQAGQCLTAQQVAAVRKVYAGAHTADGKALEAGALMPGSELNWVGVFVPRSADQPVFSGIIALSSINHLLFAPDAAPAYTIANFSFTEEMARKLEAARAFYDADNADLSLFTGHGGKLILYHGWADPHISPLSTLDYFERVGARLGADKRDAALRLFLLPGMGHCSGGDGPSAAPLLEELMAWVEKGSAPQAVEAHRASQGRAGQPGGMRGMAGGRPGEGRHWGPPSGAGGQFGPPPGADGQMPPPPEGARHAQGFGPGGPGGKPGEMGPPPGLEPDAVQLPPRARPVYAWPQVAVYKGQGPVDEATSFTAGAAAPAGLIDWLGAR